MTSTNPDLIKRVSFDAEKLMADFPPKLRHRNKQAVFRAACSEGCDIRGTVVYTRWDAMMLPPQVDASRPLIIDGQENHYDYAPVDADPSAVEWHVNFADPHLFFAYGSGLLAQDEMQVAEHPVLASLLEALYAEGDQPLTVQAHSPTPILVRGAERRVRIATDVNPQEGRPIGLYGNRFAMATVDTIERAAKRIDPPTITNLIAMAAPSGGTGKYTLDDILYVTKAAYTGFRAARMESADAVGANAKTIIHTGFWGCGAFGGNRVLMAILQQLAAHLAGIDRLVFHTFDRAGSAALTEAEKIHEGLLGTKGDRTLKEHLNTLVNMGFRWGVSDGN